MKNARFVSLPGALIVLLCFFLPWVTISCQGQQLATFSGYDLAAGAEINNGFAVQQTEGDALLFGVAAAAVVALVIAVLATQLPPPLGGGAQIVAGGAGLAILLLKWREMSENMAQQGAIIETEFGLWGTIIGLIVVCLGGGVMLTASRSRSRYGGWDDDPDDLWFNDDPW